MSSQPEEPGLINIIPAPKPVIKPTAQAQRIISFNGILFSINSSLKELKSFLQISALH
jgi:hypothetical protein